jgi:hypothetical protein
VDKSVGKTLPTAIFIAKKHISLLIAFKTRIGSNQLKYICIIMKKNDLACKCSFLAISFGIPFDCCEQAFGALLYGTSRVKAQNKTT